MKTAEQTTVSVVVAEHVRCDENGDGALSNGARRLWPFLKLLRPHQWAKNVLLFVPVITSHRLLEWPVTTASLLAFVAFSMAASAVYILNDLMDIPSDRRHPTKKYRPLASGAISIPVGLAICPIALGASIGVAALLPRPFLGMVMLYLLISTAYTFWLKKKLMVDVLCLAGLYTLRIVAGGAASGIPMTPWLLAFSMFMFLSLAFVKRYTELAQASKNEEDKLAGRGYLAIDLEMIRSVGPSSAYVAVLVICLYINDHQSTALYHRPEWLWLLCPVILFWISRIWFLAQRGQLHTDPVLFTLIDPKSWVAGLTCVTIIVAATFL